MTNKRIYIAGAISGISNYEYNFNSAEQYLRRRGFELVVNPVNIADNYSKKLNLPIPKIPYNSFFKQDINELMHCDAVFMLKGWEHSMGAKAEHAVAVALGMEIIYQ